MFPASTHTSALLQVVGEFEFKIPRDDLVHLGVTTALHFELDTQSVLFTAGTCCKCGLSEREQGKGGREEGGRRGVRER